jgi:DUF4097 and DUF4098 domain-containing protein YvlB
MEMRISGLCLSLCLIVAACAPTAVPTPVDLKPKTLQVGDAQTIYIEINQGELLIVGNASHTLEISGQTIFPGQIDYRTASVGDQISVTANYTGGKPSDIPIQLEVSVPNGIKVKVDTRYASVVVRDYDGDLQVASVSGNITVENVSGRLVAHSSRGDVSVQNSAGKINLIGNYGRMDVKNVTGELGISTFMGSITFNGPISIGDAMRFETQHALVIVNLSPESALSLQVNSNSGEVACMLPGINAALRSCEGELNSGGGSLTVQSRSGAITIKLIR